MPATSSDTESDVGSVGQPLIGQGSKAGSCWGKCGSAIPTTGGTCSCSSACELSGNCCQDKHTFCSVQAATGSVAERTIAGPGSGVSGLYGTDLGFTYEHKGKLEILFGDTWANNDSLCGGVDMLASDDAFGTLSVADRNAALTVTKTGATFRPITLTDGFFGLPLPWGMTPTTGFSDGTSAYALFYRSQDRQLEPNYGASYTELAYRPDETKPTEYLRMQRLFTSKFINVTATTVKTFTGTSTGADYATSTTPGAVFIWGRSGFADTGDGAPMYLMYNSLTARSGNTFVWNPRYFKEMSGTTPVWSSSEADAKPIQSILKDFDAASQMDIAWIAQLGKWVMFYGGAQPDWFFTDDNEHPRRGAIHMRLADNPWGPWSDPTPIALPSDLATKMACELAADEGAISPHDDPGPWAFDAFGEAFLSDKFKSFCTAGDPFRPNPAFGDCLQGDWFACFAAGIESCLPRSSSTESFERGNLYAPNIIPSWTVDQKGVNGYGKAVDLYWNVSTWNPYLVTLVKTRIELPDSLARYGHPYRLDSNLYDYVDNPSGTTLNALGTSAAALTNHFTFERISGPSSEHLTLNDLVRIRARSGQYLKWTAGSNAVTLVPLASASTWRLQSGTGVTDKYSVNSGSQRLAINTTEATPRRLRAESSGSAIRVANAAISDSARFRISWGWQ